MFKLFPGKSPFRMRIEAERAQRRASSPTAGSIDPAQRPQLHADNPDEIDATTDWLAHIAAGRITVR